MDLDMHLELFEQALDELESDADLVNQVLEITMDESAIDIRRYQLPAVEA
jgi:frataxin-like iron-binding protein CyaY